MSFSGHSTKSWRRKGVGRELLKRAKREKSRPTLICAKTTIAKGIARGLGAAESDEVSSPTFTLINQYRGRVTIYHIDLYRIDTGRLDGLGLDEIFDAPNAAVIVEWAERLGSFLAPGAVRVFLEYVDEGTRKIEIVNNRL